MIMIQINMDLMIVDIDHEDLIWLNYYCDEPRNIEWENKEDFLANCHQGSEFLLITTNVVKVDLINQLKDIHTIIYCEIRIKTITGKNIRAGMKIKFKEYFKDMKGCLVGLILSLSFRKIKIHV